MKIIHLLEEYDNEKKPLIYLEGNGSGYEYSIWRERLNEYLNLKGVECTFLDTDDLGIDKRRFEAIHDEEELRKKIELWRLAAQNKADLLLYFFDPLETNSIFMFGLGFSLGSQKTKRRIIYCPEIWKGEFFQTLWRAYELLVIDHEGAFFEKVYHEILLYQITIEKRKGIV